MARIKSGKGTIIWDGDENTRHTQELDDYKGVVSLVFSYKDDTEEDDLQGFFEGLVESSTYNVILHCESMGDNPVKALKQAFREKKEKAKKNGKSTSVKFTTFIFSIDELTDGAHLTVTNGERDYATLNVSYLGIKTVDDEASAKSEVLAGLKKRIASKDYKYGSKDDH